MKKLYFKLRIWIARKLNPKATSVFWYSKKQHSLPKAKDFFTGEEVGECTFKGKIYSEMKGFEYGLSNWDDAKIVGIGSIHDVIWPH